MHGVIALLDGDHTARVEGLWRNVEASCGLKEIWQTPFPHFSWHIAEDYDLPGLSARLEELAVQIPPFTVRTAGLSLFTREIPVVYVPLVPSVELLDLHRRIWEATKRFALDLCPLYTPGEWVPHITLANKDVSEESLACVFSLLGTRAFDWAIRIERFAIGWNPEEEIGTLKATFNLTGS